MLNPKKPESLSEDERESLTEEWMYVRQRLADSWSLSDGEFNELSTRRVELEALLDGEP